MVALADNPLFARLSDAHRTALTEASTHRRYEPGERILEDGQESAQVFSLERGRVRIFHATPDGHEITVKVFQGPSLFGEAEALSGIPYVESAEAITESDVWVIPAVVFRTLIDDEWTVAKALCFDLARRLAISSYDEKSIALNPATVRLANYLLDYATWIADASDALRVDLTQDDMARAIGVTRRSIAKDVSLWLRDGILERKRGGYRIADPEGLRRYADERRLSLHYSLLDSAR